MINKPEFRDFSSIVLLGDLNAGLVSKKDSELNPILRINDLNYY